METKPQADSPQKSPVSKTLPQSENKDEASKQPLQNPDASSASSSGQASGSTASSESQKVPEPDSKTKSKPDASPSSAETKHNASEGSNIEANLQHPIISVDIKKSTPSETKKEVPQESKSDTAEVPPEVLASVVTTAVVNEAALAVSGSDNGHAINDTKVTSDSSKVDSVVEQELNKLSEKMKEELQLKSRDDDKSDAKPLPNGDIDHSPVKGVTDSEKGLKEVNNKESKSNAQSRDGKEESSKDNNQSNGSKTEACKNTEAVAQNQNNISDQTQNSEVTSCNGVPGIITVVGISKKDSTQNLNKEAGELTTNSKMDNASETISKPNDASKGDNSKEEGFEKIGSSYKYDDKSELDSVSSSHVDCEGKTKAGDNLIGDNLTDSAKIQSSVQKVHQDIDSSRSKQEIPDAKYPIQDEESQFKKCESSKAKSASENKGEKGVSKMDNDKDEDTQEKLAEDAVENVGGLDKSKNESISDQTTTQELKTSTEPEKPKEKDNTLETDSLKNELTSKDNIVSDTSKQTESSVMSKSGVTSATSDSAANNTTPEVEEGTEELCDMSMIASMTTSQILTEEMLNGSSMEQDKNKKNLDSMASSKDDQHKSEVCSMASATSGTCDIGVGSDERTMVRCASGDGGEEEVDGEQATTEIEISEEANTGTITSEGRQSTKSPSSSDAAEISQEKHRDAEDKPASAASRSSSIPEAIVYEPPERRRSAASSAANEKRDGDAEDKSKDELVKEDEDKDHQETSIKDTPADTNKEESDTAVTTEEIADEGNLLDDDVKATEDVLVEDEKHEKEEKEETTEGKEKGAEEDDEKDVERSDSKTEQEKTDAKDAATSHSASGGKEEMKDVDENAKKGAMEDASDVKDGDGGIEKSGTDDKEDEVQVEEENVEKSDSEKVDGEKAASEVNMDNGEKGAKEDEVPKELEEPKTLVEEEKEAKEEAAEIKDEKDADDSEKDGGGGDKNEEKAEIGEGEEKAEIGTDHDADAVKDEREAQPKNEEPETEEAQEKQSGKEDEDATTQEADNEAEKEATAEEKQHARDEASTGKQLSEEVDEPQSPTKRGRSPDKAGRRGVSPISSPPKSLKTPPSPQKPQKTTSPKKKNGALSPIKTPKTPASDTRKLPPIKAPVGLAPNPNLKNIRSKVGSFDNIKYKPGGGDKKVISTKKLEWKAAPKIGSLDHSFKGEKKRSRSKDGKDGKATDGQSGDEAEPEATQVETLIKPEGTPDMPVAIAAES